MANIDKILEDILNGAREEIRVIFSKGIYSDQPIIQTGRQMRERSEQKRRQGTEDAAASEAARRKSRQDARRAEQVSRETARQAERRAAREARSKAPDTSKTWEQTRMRPTFARNASVPERYYQLRELTVPREQAGSPSRSSAFTYGSRSANRLFYEQARFMEDFEDDYEFEGDFFQYYPTYASMTLNQMRGYFSWRTRVRKGEMPPAPLSFAFLYVYELLAGIGVTPGEEGYARILEFRNAFINGGFDTNSTFNTHLRKWLNDYVIYHGLNPSLLDQQTDGITIHVLTLLLAEQAELKRLNMARRESPELTGPVPTDSELLVALDACSSYRICGARFFKDDPSGVRFVCSTVFKNIVLHCAKRRQTDYVEGLFGSTFTTPYTMFTAAVFYDPEPHPDTQIEVSPGERYSCKDNRWWHSTVCNKPFRNSSLGAVLHEIDRQLRAACDYPYPLKERDCPVYVRKFIEKAIKALQEDRAAEQRRKEEEERRRIKIDFSQLADIRAAAAVTQEALLTDEERDVETPLEQTAPTTQADNPAPAASGLRASPIANTSLSTGVDQPYVKPAAPSAPAAPPAEVAAEPQGTQTQDNAAGLSPTELLVLKNLLDDNDPTASLPAGAPLLSLIIDSINEKLFDLIGDAAIEYLDEKPALIEDYAEDIREIVGA